MNLPNVRRPRTCWARAMSVFLVVHAAVNQIYGKMRLSLDVLKRFGRREDDRRRVSEQEPQWQRTWEEQQREICRIRQLRFGGIGRCRATRPRVVRLGDSTARAG